MQFDQYRIRPLQRDDFEQWFGLVHRNRDRLDFFASTVQRTHTPVAARAFLDELLLKADDRSYVPFVIEDMQTVALVGFLDLKNIDWHIPKAEMGGYLDIAVAGQGLATRAFRALCDHCFDTLGFAKLFLRTHVSNVPAIRVAEGAGFEREGLIRRDYKTATGEVVDLLYFGRIS
ncbi:MAG: N-acetyltransferase [Chitinophagaceae bacterium]|nr:MAG: N-acetyltransferase [Chitinophagaceae bacterium]